MNKLILSCLAFFAVIFSAQAQADPAKLAKKAAADLRTFELDPMNNVGKLAEAVEKVQAAVADEQAENNYDVWKTAGDVFNTLSTQIVSIRQLGGQLGGLTMDDLPQVNDPAMQAYEAYKRANELAEKKFQVKDVLKGLRAVQTNLNNMGIYAYEEGDFDAAYQHFAGVLDAHTMLDGSKEGSMLATEDDYLEQLYITGLAGLSANRIEEVTPLFEELKNSGAPKAAVYEALYKIEAADALDPETTLSEEEKKAVFSKAYHYLEEGREKFPEDVS
ncbi:MAG: hypothetical protein D6772_11005, partial [Bacteroidetes bacterium]